MIEEKVTCYKQMRKHRLTMVNTPLNRALG